MVTSIITVFAIFTICSVHCSSIHYISDNLTIKNEKWTRMLDPSSFSNPEDFRTESFNLFWKVDFLNKIISGRVIYEFIVVNSKATELILDTRDLNITKIISLNDHQGLTYRIGSTVSSLGEPLTIQIASQPAQSEKKIKIEIQYSTTAGCTALQWLDPLQTAGKIHPYVFSQCEAIHARSLFPCQDTPSVKATYTAAVSVPKEFQALMSATSLGEPEMDGTDNRIFRFEQKIPIPSYLTAIAVGDILGKQIGPRSRVWAEKEILDKAAFEFSETEDMIKAAEKLLGKYVWGQYDILVLPPSFPFGGMENPCLTFATPTLLAGDKSLANVIAHEIAHSWTGNLVTNKNWEHFWLNEGFTVFAERKILSALKGEEYRQFASIGGWNRLKERIDEMKPDNPLTQLVVDLSVTDPDEAFSIVPYEKGYAFLYFLEQKVGGPASFEPFLLEYIRNNSYKSIDSYDFKSNFLNYFQSTKLSDIDWDKWLYSTGMPLVKFEYDQTLQKACTELKNRWLNWDSSTRIPFHKSDLDSLFPAQIQQFLQELAMEPEVLPLKKIKVMETVYDMNNRTNSEIRFRWIRLGIRSRDTDIIPLALDFVNEQGRMKYLRPIYRDLYAWEDVRPQVIENYHENHKFMMRVTAKALLQDLHLNKMEFSVTNPNNN